MSMWRSEAASLKSVHAVGFSLQMTMYEMKHHLATNADQDGNLWCHMEGCKCTYTPYRVNIWGLRKPELNRQEGRLMIEQQVRNVLRHLKEAHKIEEHLVIKAILPKGTPPFPGREYMSCSGHVSLGMCELMLSHVNH